jgi:hypothetical protein
LRLYTGRERENDDRQNKWRQFAYAHILKNYKLAIKTRAVLEL